MADDPADRYVAAVKASKGAAFLPVLLQLLEAKVCQDPSFMMPLKNGFNTLCTISMELTGSLELQVCPRCCLRHAGVRGAIYVSAAPQVPELLSRVRASTDNNSPTEQQAVSASAAEAQAEGAAESSVLSHTAGPQPEHNSSSIANGAEHTSAVPRKASDDNSASQNGQHAAAAQDSDSQIRKPAPCSVCLGVLQCMDSLQPAAPSADVTTAVEQWDSSSNRAWQPVPSCAARDIAAQVK